MRKIYLLLSLLILIVGCQKEPSVQNEEKEEWNGIEPKFRIITLEPEELKIIEILPSFKNGSNFQENKGQVAILYDSINNIYINTKEVKKMESSNGKYHSYTFPVINPVNKNSVENLFFSLQPNGTYKVFRVVYLLSENDKDNIQKGRFVELKGKTQIIEIRKGFNIPQLLEKSSFPPTCAIVTVTYCSGSQNHPGGYNPDGSNCPAHEEYSAEFCTGGDGGGGGTQSWPTYDTGTGGTGGGGEPTDPGDGTCIADTDGNCIDDTTTVTLPPPGSVEEIYPDLFFETLGENNLQYWWTVDASDAFKIEVMNYLINEGYTAEAENFALEACFAKKAGGEVDFEEQVAVFLTGEAKKVYEKLKNLELFKRTIGVFDNNDNFCLSITYGDCETGGEGCTDGSQIAMGNVTIKIADVENSSLDLAATLLHEAVHAEIYKYVQENQTGVDPNDRINLLEYYFRFKTFEDPRFATSNAQHQHMADNYVRPIAEAIRELDKNRFPIEYYYGFAWSGLRNYGWDGYYDNGVWTTLLRNDPYENYKTTVLNTTTFPNN